MIKYHKRKAVLSADIKKKNGKRGIKVTAYYIKGTKCQTHMV